MGVTTTPPPLISAGETLLQPGTPFYRITDALGSANLTAQQVAQLQIEQANLAGYVEALQTQMAAANANIATLQGQVSTLQDQVSTLQTQMTTVQAQIAVLQSFMNSNNWVQSEVNTGLTFLDGRTLYTRSFVISGALASALSTFTYAHGIANINYVAQGIAIAGQSVGQNLPITFINAQQIPNVQDAISFFVDTVNIYIFNGNVLRTNMLVLVKLYYTCTDR